MTGNDLKKIRLTLKETQAQFAKRLNLMHYQRIYELELRRNKKLPEITALKIKVAGLDKLLKTK
jgi:transcriptional regulator with XRE-family HTH domain